MCRSLVVAGLLVAACSDAGSGGDTTSSPPTSTPVVSTDDVTTSTGADTTGVPDVSTTLMAGAASRSVLPTVDGGREYLDATPGWDGIDPNDIGVFVPTWDQGRVDVGNGNEDGSWVHDDLRATAVALSRGGTTVVMATADVYMIFSADAAEIERQARERIGDTAGDLHIIISATHNHHGPDTAFSVNDDWYELMAEQMADAISESVESMVPATAAVASSEHRFGQSDVRDPVIVDPRLNVLRLGDAGSPDRTIATIVQWASHPETTLGWNPPGDIAAECSTKGWAAEECSADGRYFTADYPGVLRERLSATLGGEVLYLNGPLGSQIGPGAADVWLVDEQHPLGDGVAPPAGAQPVAGASDLRTRNMARTEAIGAQLTAAVVEALLRSARAVGGDVLEWRQQPFYSRLTNIGFRVLLADGDLGWQNAVAFVCTTELSDETCVDDEGALQDDPVLTPLVGSQIRTGDVLRTQLTWVGVGDVGFLFMPGELPPELVIGLPDDFVTNSEAYYTEPQLHAVGADYEIPGHLLDLVPTEITFTVGLGGDELGYWVPIKEARLKCLDLVLSPDSGYTCARLFDEGLLVTPDAIGGTMCRNVTNDGDVTGYTTDQLVAIAAVCRYGQALGRELGEPDGHYEETNSAGWDLVDDTWAAAEQLFAG